MCSENLYRQVCQGSWNSETLSYNVGESLGGRGKQQENWSRRSLAGVRKTRRDRNEVRGQAGFGSGSYFFITPFGASWAVGPTFVPESAGPFSVGRHRGAS